MALSANAFQLAVFGCNVSRGCTISNAPGGIAVEWAESIRLAQHAEHLGFEALIPVCRWKGFGGPSEFNHRSFETYTWAAGLAQATTRMHIFATTAVPTIHPVLAAKQGATIDHISGGRFGLNIVAGWNGHEVAMFGRAQAPHAERYQQAAEWTRFVKALWTTSGEFDFASDHYPAPAAYAEPKPVQHPHPPIMSAGVSPAGRRFAAEHADMNFILAPDLDSARDTVLDVTRTANNDFGRSVEVWGNAAIFCRPTSAQARDYYAQIIERDGDYAAANNLLDTFTVESASQLPDPSLREAYLRNMMAGYSGFPVVGTPVEVADFITAMHACGLSGATLSWPDYDDGLARFGAEILPLLERRGLRGAAA